MDEGRREGGERDEGREGRRRGMERVLEGGRERAEWWEISNCLTVIQSSTMTEALCKCKICGIKTQKTRNNQKMLRRTRKTGTGPKN